MSLSRKLLWFLTVSLLALVIFRVVDATLYSMLPAPVSVLADLRVTSFLVVLTLCLAAPSARAFLSRPTQGPSRRIIALCILVLSLSFAVPALTGVGFVSLPRWQDRIAFHFIGVVNEELLCRGIVLGAALAVLPRASSTLRQPAVVATTIVFSLMHIQYHDFTLNSALFAQLLWTIPIGLALTALAFETRSVWPSVGVHVGNNLLVGLAEWMTTS